MLVLPSAVLVMLSCKSVSEEHTGHLLERQDNKRKRQSQNWTTSRGQHAERKTTWLAWTRDANESPAHTTSSVVLGGTRIQERTRSTTNKLEEHSQQSPRQKMGLSCEEAEVAALDRHGWRRAWSSVSTWMRDESRSRSRSTD